MKASTKEIKRIAGLEPYLNRLKFKKFGNEYKAICPWHPDQNPSLTIYLENREWRFKCFGSDGSSGDVIEFIRRMDGISFEEALGMLNGESNVKLENIAKKDATKKKEIGFDKGKATAALSMNTDALAYLATRGISKAAALRRRLGVFDFPGVGPCIAIPYPSGDVKFRAIQPKDKERKFRSFGNPNSKLYGIELLDDTTYSPTRVLVVESELDQITASEHLDPKEFVVVSVPSATASLNGGELRIEKEHIDKLKGFDGAICIATDQDPAGNGWADAALKVLPHSKTSRVAWTGAKDIGELFTKFKAGFAKEIQRLCEESFIPLLWKKAVPFATLAEKKYEWIVPDLIPADGITFVTGDFGSFKSYLSYFLADAISTGSQFIGRRCQTHPVLILDRENSYSTVYRRRSLVGKLQDSDDVRILGLFTDPPAPEVTDQGLLAVCARIKPVVIIDSLTDFHPGLKENDPDDMTECLSNIRNLVTTGAVAVIVLHHVPKGGKGKGGSYRGSTSIPAAGTNALLIEKHDKYTAKIQGFKSRDGEDQKIELKLNFRSDAVTYEVINSGRDSEAVLLDEIEEYVQKNDGCRKNSVSTALHKRKEKVNEKIDDMVRAGRLNKDKDGGLHSNRQLEIAQVVPESGNRKTPCEVVPIENHTREPRDAKSA